MRPVRNALGMLFLALAFATPIYAQKLKWSGASEKSPTIEAEFVRVDGDNVILKKDGKEIPVSLSKLSLESHLQALKLANPEAYSKPVPKAVVGLPLTDDAKKLMESPFPENATVEQFLDTIISELENNNSTVLWHALTPEMQTDVEDLFISSMDKGGKQLLVQIKTLTKHLSTLAHDKKPMIMSSSWISRDANLAKQLDFQWPQLTAFIDALAEKQNWDASNFRAGNFAPWLMSMMDKLRKGTSGAQAFAKVANPRMPAIAGKLKEVYSYKVLSQKEDKATIQTGNPELIAMFAVVKQPANPPPQQGGMGGMGGMSGMPGMPSQNRPAPPKAQKIELVKVSGRWLPKTLVEKWKDHMESAKSDAELSVASASQGLSLVIPVVSMLAKSTTTQEFNNVLDRLTAAVGLGQRGGGSGMMGMGGMSGGPDSL